MIKNLLQQATKKNIIIITNLKKVAAKIIMLNITMNMEKKGTKATKAIITTRRAKRAIMIKNTTKGNTTTTVDTRKIITTKMATTMNTIEETKEKKATNTKRKDTTTKDILPRAITKYTNLMNSRKIRSSSMKRVIPATKRSMADSTKSMATRKEDITRKDIITEGITSMSMVKRDITRKEATIKNIKVIKKPPVTTSITIIITITPRKEGMSTTRNTDIRKVIDETPNRFLDICKRLNVIALVSYMLFVNNLSKT